MALIHNTNLERSQQLFMDKLLVDADFPGPGTYSLSVWINEAGATMLISDVFTVTVD